MPHTLPYRPTLIDSLTSTHRINTYQNVFQTNNDVELMGAYLWSQHMSGMLYPLLSATEVSLRNAIDQALTQMLGVFWWKKGVLRCRSEIRNNIVSDPLRKVRENFAKAHNAHLYELKKLLPKNSNITPAASHQGIIAQTDFSTWEFLFDDEFLDHHLIWPAKLNDVFQGAWPSKSTKKVLKHARDLINAIRVFRNRLAHHEPIWKRYGVRTEADAIQSLHDRLGTIETLLKLVHPEYHRMLIINGLIPMAYRAASSAEIRRYQHRAKTEKIRTVNNLGKVVAEATASDRIIEASMYCGGKRRFLITPY